METLQALAAGVTQLRVGVERGNIHLRAAPGAAWGLEWSTDGEDEPEVERDGDALRIRQRGRSFLKVRMDLRLTIPSGLECVELRTGWGRVDAEGLQGRSVLNTGNGGLALRHSGGDTELNSGNGEVLIETYTGDLKASTGNGATRILCLKGNVRLHTGNGRVEVSDADGSVRANSGNGDIVLEDVGGEVELSTGHGHVRVISPRALALRANSGMGAIEIDGGSVRTMRVNSMVGEVSSSAELLPGKYEISTGMGAIRLALQPNTGVRIDAQTSFGQVHSDFPLVRVGRSGPMGFGGVRMVGSTVEAESPVEVSLRSGKGDIEVRLAPVSRAAAPSPPPTAPGPEGDGSVVAAPESDGTLAILEAVARGEISPEEADRLLAAGAR